MPQLDTTSVYAALQQLQIAVEGVAAACLAQTDVAADDAVGVACAVIADGIVSGAEPDRDDAVASLCMALREVLEALDYDTPIEGGDREIDLPPIVQPPHPASSMTPPKHTAVHAALSDFAAAMSALADGVQGERADACDHACTEIAQQIIPAGVADRGDQIMALAEHLSELLIALTAAAPEPFLRRVQ